MACSVVVGYQHFRGPRCFHLQGGDGGSMDLWNVGILPHHYTASQPRRPWLERNPSTLTEYEGSEPLSKILCTAVFRYVGFESQQGLRILLITASGPVLRPIQPPIQWVAGALSQGGKAAGVWSWTLPSNQHPGQECVELYHYSTNKHRTPSCSWIQCTASRPISFKAIHLVLPTFPRLGLGNGIFPSVSQIKFSTHSCSKNSWKCQNPHPWMWPHSELVKRTNCKTMLIGGRPPPRNQTDRVAWRQGNFLSLFFLWDLSTGYIFMARYLVKHTDFTLYRYSIKAKGAGTS